jgi:hypothetical protein
MSYCGANLKMSDLFYADSVSKLFKYNQLIKNTHNP